MKVKIICCHNEKSWYYNRIGECFDVCELTENVTEIVSNYWYGVFDDKNNNDFTVNRIIKKSESIPVNELRMKKLKRLITQYGNTT